MTGEITLRGRVLPIGGLKEKILAAHRGRIKTVILPKENRKDIHEIPLRVLKTMRLVLVEHMDDVLCEALSDTSLPRKFGARDNVMVYEKGQFQSAEGPSETEKSEKPNANANANAPTP
jgi:ATP-dependent Lon protease